MGQASRIILRERPSLFRNPAYRAPGTPSPATARGSSRPSSVSPASAGSCRPAPSPRESGRPISAPSSLAVDVAAAVPVFRARDAHRVYALGHLHDGVLPAGDHPQPVMPRKGSPVRLSGRGGWCWREDAVRPCLDGITLHGCAPVPQHADALDLELHDVSGLEEPSHQAASPAPELRTGAEPMNSPAKGLILRRCTQRCPRTSSTSRGRALTTPVRSPWRAG